MEKHRQRFKCDQRPIWSGTRASLLRGQTDREETRNRGAIETRGTIEMQKRAVRGGNKGMIRIRGARGKGKGWKRRNMRKEIESNGV